MSVQEPLARIEARLEELKLQVAALEGMIDDVEDLLIEIRDNTAKGGGKPPKP